MPQLQGVDAGEERRHPAAGPRRGRKKKALSDTSLLSKAQARSSPPPAFPSPSRVAG